jgi:hypothetical protein
MTVLEGQAGTGKGVVLAAASQAWREVNRRLERAW